MKSKYGNRILTAGTVLAFLGLGAPLVARAQFVPYVKKQGDQTPVRRTTIAVSYPDGRKTSVDMTGGAVSPRVRGKAEIERKEGRTKIKVKLEGITNPQNLGARYTTYVVWAISPEGQADNLGQMVFENSSKSEFEATTPFQRFGIIVTAEPHPRVKLPGSAMVAENVVRADTRGDITSGTIEYRYDTFEVSTSGMSPDFQTPLPVLGARLSVEMARMAGANEYARSEFQSALDQLAVLERNWPQNRDRSSRFNQNAMDTVRLAEVAREASFERVAASRLDSERRAAENRVTDAQSDARQSRSESDSYRASLARTESELAAARMTLRDARTETDQAKAREDVARLEAEFARADARKSKAEAEQAGQESDQAKQALAEARNSLYDSVSVVLETRRETRGLIVNLSDIQFDFNQATLKPGAREKLSKLSGILMAYSGTFRLDIEGHTDSIGTEDYNLRLSQSRADAVRSFLIQAGVPAARFTPARGLGKANPINSNDTAEGRMMNRRVEIVIADSELTATPPQ